MKNALGFLLFCAIVEFTGALHAQTGTNQITLVGAPANLVTTGGVTYAQYDWSFGGCDIMVQIGPLVSEGNNLSFDFEFGMETGVACPEFIVQQSATVVLGALAPGNYTLTTTSWGSPVATNVFTVPTNSAPMLQPIGFAADGSFQMQLNGFGSVGYLLQTSTNLTSWTTLSTNFVGQALADPSPAGPAQRFYRLQIPRTVFGP